MNTDSRPDEFDDDSDRTEDDLDSSDLDYPELPCTDAAFDDGTLDDDARWEAFIADEDEMDPEPGPGDFWMENRSYLPISLSPCLVI